MTTELSITGMTCGHCERAVREALLAVPGVENAQVNLPAGQATVTGSVDPQALVQAVSAEGYSAQLRS
ncbi:heavy metal transport/detoxification protein [Deinococcus sp. HMF7620]|uniref:Heavy metal transport/detoxification protein n=1 Tax=Deinococcus arboris TaxID=2682977 RepID=A0A7C9HWL9_9DEIO|nr:heavy metal-associated domain-containing protein [Deinococcus arboris]MVN85648.1 heavy metal transport/detoxification protein [Deinococcus arboris]